jgi:1-acyl-sn-glycerol-3-phosphate acyltransferase
MNARRVVRWWKLARLGVHVAEGLLKAGLVYPRLAPAQQRAMVQGWSSRLLRILRIEIEVSEPLRQLDSAAFFAANHVSWLDVFLINSVAPARFVAKAEIRDWPVLGWLCAQVGTVFIERDSPRAAWRVGQELNGLLERGENVAIFPEGTASDGSTVHPFHASLLEPAVRGERVVLALGVRFLRADGSTCREVAYDGDRKFTDSLHGILSQAHIRAELVLAAALDARGRERRSLARHAREKICHALNLLPNEAAGSDRAAPSSEP